MIKQGVDNPSFDITPEEAVRWLTRYERRAILAERSIGLFFGAVACFVADSLAIAFDVYRGAEQVWLIVGLAALGSILMFIGVGFMMLEAHLGGQQLHEEISEATKRLRSRT